MANYYIYKMIHIPSGRVYIGQRKLPKGKTIEADNYFGSGKIWKRIYKKYPDECIKVIIDIADNKNDINELEKKYIKHYKDVYGDFCVNLAEGGIGNQGPVSLETREKRSKSLKGRIISDEHRKKISNSLKGKKPSIETRIKMGIAHKVHWKTCKDDTRNKMLKNLNYSK